VFSLEVSVDLNRKETITIVPILMSSSKCFPARAALLKKSALDREMEQPGPKQRMFSFDTAVSAAG
jgi:hypothetical protein